MKKLLERLFEERRTVNEDLFVDDLLTVFDDIWSEETYKREFGEEDGEYFYKKALPKIKKAREIVASWQKQLQDRGYSGEMIPPEYDLPSLWWEGTDAWDMGPDAPEEYLDDIIEYGPNLPTREEEEEENL